MLLLVSDDQIAAEDLLLSADLLLMLLNQGHTKDQYSNLIECIDEIWRKIREHNSDIPELINLSCALQGEDVTFKKAFYIEDGDLAEMSEDELEEELFVWGG